MNFFKLKNPSSPPEPPQATLQLPPLPPPIAALQQAFTSLQTQFTSFLHNHLPPPSFPPATSPLWAKIHNPYDFTSGKGKGLAMSWETIEERLAVIPVYALFKSSDALFKSSEQMVAISGVNSGNRLSMFCFNEADAEAILQQMKSLHPSLSDGCQVLPVALSKVFPLKVDGVTFRLIPEASQVNNAISETKKVCITAKDFPGIPVFQSKSLGLKWQEKNYCPVFFRMEDMEKALERVSQEQRSERTLKPSFKERKKVCSTAKDFPGIPFFQSKSLALRSQQRRYRPVFFRKEDLEKSLERASQEQQTLKPSLRRGDIQVASLEDIIKGMKDDSSTTWDDVVFVPPGFDVSASSFLNMLPEKQTP